MTGQPIKGRTAKVFLAVVGVLAAGFGLVQCGRYAGEQLGAATLAQMQLVWPNVLSFSDEERRLLAELALECRVTEEPPAAAAVLACLHKAADARDSKDGQAQAGAELRRLVRTKGGG